MGRYDVTKSQPLLGLLGRLGGCCVEIRDKETDEVGVGYGDSFKEAEHDAWEKLKQLNFNKAKNPWSFWT